MPFDFPNSPTTGQIATGPNGVLWSWDGVKWIVVSSGSAAPVAPNQPYGDNDTSVANTAFVQSAVSPAYGVGRNFLHNSMMAINQRAIGTVSAANAYTVDRWYVGLNTDTVAISQNAISDGDRSQIGDEAAQFRLRNQFTGSASAAAYNVLSQKIEGVRRLSGKTVTVSFWANSSVGGLKIGVSLDQVFGTGGSPSGPVSLNGVAVTLATTWARYSATFSVPSASGMTLGTNNDDLTILNLWCSSGTTQAARAGSIGVQSGTINIWGVQLELGTQATPLERVDPADDLRRCQRFYCNLFFQSFSYTLAGNGFWATLVFPVTMRAAPSVTFSSTSLLNLPSLTTNAAVPGSIVVGNTATASQATGFYSYVQASADL